jgi:acyl-coenzyme A thioesterase PaaI-like protein
MTNEIIIGHQSDDFNSSEERSRLPESFDSKLTRWRFNLFPAYFFTGARITYISHDFREVKIRLPLSWRTRNVVGTIFGGSMYGAIDPIFMVMLIKILGNDYIVWDKGAEIQFRKPGRGVLFARFFIPEEELELIRIGSKENFSVDRIYDVELVDKKGEVHASARKIVYIRRKDAVR